MTAQQTVGEALIGLLESYGVELVFGIPGVHTLELYKALPQSRIRHVLTRHEQGAAFMADGYARASGKPGVCFAITGPGVTNAATAIGQAYSDSVPVLMISAVNQRASLGKGLGHLHEMKDQRALTAPITGFSATALMPADVPDLVARAFALFKGQRPRPVHIEIPLDVLAAPAEGDWTPRPLAGPPAPPAPAIEAAAELLRQAKRPLLLAGGGALDAGAELVALAERLGAVAITTVAAKGVISSEHPLNGGTCLSTAAGQALVRESDVVLVLGSELAETDHWSDRLHFDGALIRVDLDAGKLSDLYPAKLPILGDAQQAAAALLAALGEGGPQAASGWGAARAARVKAEVLAAQGKLQQRHGKVLSVLESLLNGGLVSTDMTQIAYTGNVVFPADRPRSWLHPMGFGTLGFGLPAAIGAKLGQPGRAVVALVGDHGFLYTAQDLATAVEERLPLVVVLWNNNGLAQIRDDMIHLGMQQIAVTPRNPDYLGLARAYGCKALSVGSLEELEEKLTAALADSAVTLIEVPDRIVPET